MYDQGPGGYGMHDGIGIVEPLVSIVVVVLFLWFYGRIVGRAGYSPWWALIMLVPVVNMVMLWVFAFTRWPALDRVSDEAAP